MAELRSIVLVGVLSDTHGVFDPRIADALDGVSHIIHAGDVGHPRVLWELEAIAPVTAVLGNTDSGELLHLRLRESVTVNGCRVLVVHELEDLEPRGLPSATRVIVSGHTHVARVEEIGGVLYVNPGSTARPRGGSVRSVALLEITRQGVSARIVELP